MDLLSKHTNGNATIELYEDGTRIVQFEDKLELDYPLNVDIRVSNRCPFGLNPKTGKGKCMFCHESATINGEECDYEELKHTVDELPKGTELAIGCNDLTAGLYFFITWAADNGYICNLTVNQMLLNNVSHSLKLLTKENKVKGLGISYRKNEPMKIPKWILNYEHTVLHVIAGIDDVDDIIATPFKKVLVLGYKKFGFGKDYYSEEVEKNIQQWYWWVHKLIDNKDVVSFDNLALKQLNMKRFLQTRKWEEFNQGEHSMYINAVDKYLAPSSRSNDTLNWCNITLKEYFNHIENKRNGS